MKDRDFDNANFALRGGFKDINLFIAMAHDMSEKDWSAITEITREQANIQPPQEK